jgi:hypothetical protein
MDPLRTPADPHHKARSRPLPAACKPRRLPARRRSGADAAHDPRAHPTSAAALDAWPRQRDPGLRFVYWSGLPDICALLLDGAVVTVLTREMFRSLPRRHGRVRALSPPPSEECRWRWNGDLEDAA